MNKPTDMIKRATVSQMVDAYYAALADWEKGFQLLRDGKARLEAAFDTTYNFEPCDRKHHRPEEEANVSSRCKDLKCQVWRQIAEKMQLRRLLTQARVRELDDQLNNPAKLPDITVDAIMGMVESMMQNVDTYLTEAVYELYDLLRPRDERGYKTNSPYKVGERVIMRYWIDQASWNSRVSPSYHRDTEYRIIDNVFSMLDGKGGIKSHHGPLRDSICEAGRHGKKVGSTDYFEWKAYRGTGTLHIRFRRMDLVHKLNEIAGSRILPKGEGEHAA